MSDSREQSYYEIALTNRQVMGVFVVLLVCVLAAFLGGVWIGRGQTPVVNTVEPEAIASGVTDGEEPLRQLGFFSRTDEAESGGAASEPESEAGAEEPIDDRPMPVATADAEPSQPVIIEEIGKRPEPTVAPAGESSAGSNAEPQPASPAPQIIPPGPVSGTVVVQVFSSTDEAHARRVMERVRSGGYPAVLSPIDVDGTAMFRVRVGPYTDRNEAQSVADRIRRGYKLDTWITR